MKCRKDLERVVSVSSARGRSRTMVITVPLLYPHANTCEHHEKMFFGVDR
jgi:hypothetical protein